MRRGFIIRIRILFAGFVCVVLVLLFRLYTVEIVRGEYYRQLAERQYVQPMHGLYDRGTIFFQDKENRLVAGATLKSGYLLAVNPQEVPDAGAAYQKLSPYISLDREIFLSRVAKKDDPYEELAHHIDEDTAHKVEELAIPGVHLYRERWRYYPGDTLAAQTLGFVGYQGSSLMGLYGLERYWGDVLERKQANLHVNFFAEIFSNLNETLFAKERARAGDIVTSIEPSVQVYVEQKVKEVQSQWHSKITAAIVMDPKTGEIVAMASTPTFDANNFNKESNPAIYGNPLVEDVFEMGSIIKPISMSIGIDTGAVTPQTTYNDPGFITLDGYKISNYDHRGRGVVPMQEVLNQSLNTGVAFVASRVGKEKFGDRMRAFKIGEETGIDLPSEAHGLIDNLSSPRMVEYATASFGQGIALTPIATVRALAALANGGKLVTPHIVKRIQYESGASQDVSYHDDDVRAVSENAAFAVTRMLVTVVDTALLGGSVKIPHYSIAAKTGTAQIAKKGSRGYYEDRYLHSFFGYFPAYDPRFIVFIYTVEPQGAQYASNTLTYPVMDVIKFLINYYEIPPDR